MKIQFELNGNPVDVDVQAEQNFMTLLRETFGLIGTKEGCSIGECGTCSVLVNGELRKSCLMLAPQINGSQVVTIEGLANSDGGPSDLQQAFLNHGSVQCGFCTPGMVVASEALLSETLTPTREEIREAISGNLCRCTGYQQIVNAVEDTAEKRRIVKEVS